MLSFVVIGLDGDDLVTPIDSGTDQILIGIDPQPRPADVAACTVQENSLRSAFQLNVPLAAPLPRNSMYSGNSPVVQLSPSFSLP